ncbi:MAG: DNA-3-methyladenine glycosylase [Ktedonobacteraceae bacterium]
MTPQSSLADIITTATAYLSAIDPVMAAAIRRVGPCTLVPNPDIFEALIDAIISQQISVKAADTMVARLRAATPGAVLAPDALLTLQHEDLRALGFTTQKSNYMRNLTEQVVSGQLDLEQLPLLDDETVISKLTALKGIGRWTAEMILIFSLARPNVLPVDDLGFVEGVRVAYALPTRPTPKEMRERGELWRPFRTFATWYMWAIRRAELQQSARERTRIVSL